MVVHLEEKRYKKCGYIKQTKKKRKRDKESVNIINKDMWLMIKRLMIHAITTQELEVKSI